MRGNEPSFPAMEKERRTAPPSARPPVRPSVRPLVTSSIVQRNDPNYARNRRVSIGDESTNQILKYLIIFFFSILEFL